MKNDLHLRWLKDEGAIVEEDNIVHAPRAFVANSILKWCVKKIKEKSLNETQIEEYLKSDTVEFQDGFIKHSYHRAVAMIGRLINGKKLHDHEEHGLLTIEDILVHSSNIGISKIY